MCDPSVSSVTLMLIRVWIELENRCACEGSVVLDSTCGHFVSVLTCAVVRCATYLLCFFSCSVPQTRGGLPSSLLSLPLFYPIHPHGSDQRGFSPTGQFNPTSADPRLMRRHKAQNLGPFQIVRLRFLLFRDHRDKSHIKMSRSDVDSVDHCRLMRRSLCFWSSVTPASGVPLSLCLTRVLSQPLSPLTQADEPKDKSQSSPAAWSTNLLRLVL